METALPAGCWECRCDICFVSFVSTKVNECFVKIVKDNCNNHGEHLQLFVRVADLCSRYIQKKENYFFISLTFPGTFKWKIFHRPPARLDMSGPRIPLSQMNGGNKRPNSVHRMTSADKPFCAQHDDLIKFIYESWDKVARESNHGNGVTYYKEQEPNPNLKDFEPFDLEAWWGQRLVQNMTQPQHS